MNSLEEMRTWRPRPLAIAAAGCVLAYAIALTPHGGLALLAAGLIVADLAIQMLPWRLPRSSRTGWSIWLEALACLGGLTAFAVTAVVVGAPWMYRIPNWKWFVIAAAAGVGLAALGGINFRLLLSGDLAFMLGPVNRPHGWARATTAAVAPLGEEAAFRAVVLGLAPASAFPVALLGAIGFVARHYVPHGVAPRGSTANVLAEIAAAVLFLILTMASGSVLPALVAHLANNLPRVILEVQRCYEVSHV